MRKTSPVIVSEIRRLSQEEGLKDEEIASIIKYNRVTVQKIRKAFGIPTYNLANRKDRPAKCPQCGKDYFTRRHEKFSICCEECAAKANNKFYESLKQDTEKTEKKEKE